MSEDSSTGTSASGSPTGKGRPTPKRPTSRGPVAPPPATRKEAAKRVREGNASRRQSARKGFKAGEEHYLLKRDQGPVRKLVRDLVDSRRTVATYLMPAAVIPLLASLLTTNRNVLGVAQFLWILTIMLALADFFSGYLRMRRAIGEQFPEERRLRGHVFYGFMRMLQFRRMRVPKPAVELGDTV